MLLKKTLLITGASNGIGFELVKTAVLNGYKVFAISRNINNLKSLKGVVAFSVDLTDENDIKGFVDELINQKIKLDIVINNAGSLINKPFMNTSMQDFKNIFGVNIFGVASLLRICLPLIEKDGHVINISSMGGVQGSAKFPGLSAYSSSKGALITLTELLAEEFKESGPSFNVLALGAVQTEMLKSAFPGYKAKITPQQMAQYIFDFSMSGHKLFNGKLIPVSLSTP
ncbi:MAG: short-chain dehydrogenase [Flavobacteriaceae bacterium]|nr:short-chain dehydrogenase [Flavobacteriaceae bacterium]|tara:strand:+ start:11743 stop:12426 length:684 start_codon:yes stop_codon:yes gene_type:complete